MPRINKKGYATNQTIFWVVFAIIVVGLIVLLATGTVQRPFPRAQTGGDVVLLSSHAFFDLLHPAQCGSGNYKGGGTTNSKLTTYGFGTHPISDIYPIYDDCGLSGIEFLQDACVTLYGEVAEPVQVCGTAGTLSQPWLAPWDVWNDKVETIYVEQNTGGFESPSTQPADQYYIPPASQQSGAVDLGGPEVSEVLGVDLAESLCSVLDLANKENPLGTDNPISLYECSQRADLVSIEGLPTSCDCIVDTGPYICGAEECDEVTGVCGAGAYGTDVGVDTGAGDQYDASSPNYVDPGAGAVGGGFYTCVDYGYRQVDSPEACGCPVGYTTNSTSAGINVFCNPEPVGAVGTGGGGLGSSYYCPIDPATGNFDQACVTRAIGESAVGGGGVVPPNY